MIRPLATLMLAMTLGAGAQQPGFAVATVKPSQPDTPTVTQIRGKRFVTTGTTFLDLFRYAFNVHASQVSGPEWLRTQKFDIVADPEGEQRPTSDEMKALVRQLLVSRFQVKLHEEERELPVFVLQKAEAAPKLTVSKADFEMPSGGLDGRGLFGMRNGTMANLVNYLQRFGGPAIDRPILDETGIPGKYDLALRFDPDPTSSVKSDLPDIFTAIREQLALRLKAEKRPVTVYVIETAVLPAVDS